MTRLVGPALLLVALAFGATTAQADTVLDSDTGTRATAFALLQGGTRYRHVTIQAASEDGSLWWAAQWSYRCDHRESVGAAWRNVVKKGGRADDESTFSAIFRVPAAVRNERAALARCTVNMFVDDGNGLVESTVVISASRQ